MKTNKKRSVRLGLACDPPPSYSREQLTKSGGGVIPYSGLYGEAPPESGAFLKHAVYKRLGKIAILVHERVTKSAAKRKKWWVKRSISKGATFWQE